MSQGEFADDQDDMTQQAAYLEQGQEEVQEEKDAKEKFTGEAKEGITDGDGEEDDDEEEEEASASSSDDESASEEEDEVTEDNANADFTPAKKERRKKKKTVCSNMCHSTCSYITDCVANLSLCVCR